MRFRVKNFDGNPRPEVVSANGDEEIPSSGIEHVCDGPCLEEQLGGLGVTHDSAVVERGVPVRLVLDIGPPAVREQVREEAQVAPRRGSVDGQIRGRKSRLVQLGKGDHRLHFFFFFSP